MNTHFFFCHGMGFDQNFWKNLAPLFPKAQSFYVDLGYFGRPCEFTPVNVPQLRVGIGHSFGLQKLLQLSIKFDYLIGLNGFVNFLGNDPKIRVERHRELQLLRAHFCTSPEITLRNFYKRCGIPLNLHPPLFDLNIHLFLKDLKELAFLVPAPTHTPLLIIGAKDDVIVPPHVLFDNFRSPNVSIDLLDSGSHGLGFLKPDLIATKIKEFLPCL